jgi:hypothetical protein
MAIVHIDFRTISWGGPNEDDSNDVWQVEDGSNDPGEIVLEDFGTVGTPINGFPAPPTIGPAANPYKFVFWNATSGVSALDNYPSTGPKLNIPNMSGVVHATAWYTLPGGNGPGSPVLRARTFDVDLNNFRKETPISSATPAGAWPGPNNHSVSTATENAAATAKNALLYPEPFPSQPPGTLAKYFQSWLAVTGPITADAAPGHVVHCSAKHSGLALAFFGHGKPLVIGKPGAGGTIYDWWAEFWGKRGAEGTGPWGPHGPSDPVGPLTQRWFASLSPEQQQTALGLIAAKRNAGGTEFLP